MYYVLYLSMNKKYLDTWKSQLKRGTLPLFILNIINDNTLYGYELIKKIMETSSIQVSEGTLYPLLNRLNKENLVSYSWVEQESGIPRKYYSLTNEGKEVLNEMNIHWNFIENSLNKIISNGNKED